MIVLYQEWGPGLQPQQDQHFSGVRCSRDGKAAGKSPGLSELLQKLLDPSKRCSAYQQRVNCSTNQPEIFALTACKVL